MKIQFVWFNTGAPLGMSIGVSILSTELARAGHEVKILHLNEKLRRPYELGRMIEETRAYGPDLVALSFGSFHAHLAREFCAEVKLEYPRAWVLCGGVHPTQAPEDVIRWPGVDCVFVGEADGWLTEFVGRLDSGARFEEVPGFLIRRNGDVRRNPMAPLPDIGDQAGLNFDLVDYRLLTELRRGTMDILAGRGCPWRCTYCQAPSVIALYRRERAGVKNSDYLRQRKVENLLAELRRAREVCGGVLKYFTFADDVFLFDKTWLRGFAEAYSGEVGLPYTCCCNAPTVDEETASCLAGSGCVMVRFGTETGDEKFRRRVLGKPLKNRHIRRCVEVLRRHRINSAAYVMIGVPGETEAGIQETFSFHAEIELDFVRCAIYYPLPGTELGRHCSDHGLIDRVDAPVTNYFERSILKWPASMRLFIEKTRVVFPWLLNTRLKDCPQEPYERALKRVYDMAAEEWRDPNRIPWFLEESERMAEPLRRAGIAHYFSPFEDRTDAAVLYRQRDRKIPNVDDGWPAGAP